MTYCAGWASTNSAFLLADSAITSLSPLRIPTSSFGQPHREVRGENVEEGLLKIARIDSHAAVAFAGDVAMATDIVDYLMAHWKLFCGNMQELDRALKATFGPLDTTPDVEILIAWFDGEPHLVRWGSRDGIYPPTPGVVDIGSIGNAHRDFAEAALRQALELGIPDSSTLSLLIALTQSYCIHDDMIRQNIGGAVFGVSVCDSGVVWQRDTSYLIYDRHSSHADFVRVGARDDALIVSSSFSNGTLVMMNSAVPDWRSWKRIWSDEMEIFGSYDHFPLACFIRKEDRLITVLDRTPGKDGPYMRFRLDGSTLHLDLTDKLQQVLFHDLEKEELLLPFRLVALHDPP